jgi:hypothetical protein
MFGRYQEAFFYTWNLRELYAVVTKNEFTTFRHLDNLLHGFNPTCALMLSPYCQPFLLFSSHIGSSGRYCATVSVSSLIKISALMLPCYMELAYSSAYFVPPLTNENRSCDQQPSWIEVIQHVDWTSLYV